MTTRTCMDCPHQLGPKNTSGRCRPCLAKHLNSDPDVARRRREGIARRMADPEHRAAHLARVAELNRNLPEHVRESRRRHGKLKAAKLAEVARNMSAESRAKAGRSRSDTVLAWCPPEWRDRYRDLKKRGRRASEAKHIILDLIAGKPAPTPYAQQKAKLAWCPPSRRDEYRRLCKSLGAAEARRIVEASMTSFDRQMARVAAGARIVVKPVIRRPDYSYTLGGVAPEAM